MDHLSGEGLDGIGVAEELERREDQRVAHVYRNGERIGRIGREEKGRGWEAGRVVEGMDAAHEEEGRKGILSRLAREMKEGLPMEDELKQSKDLDNEYDLQCIIDEDEEKRRIFIILLESFQPTIVGQFLQ